MTRTARHRPWTQAIRTRETPDGTLRGYLRFAALGDSLSCGHPGSGRPRTLSWAELLASSIAHDHDVSFCDLTQAGATTNEVRKTQAPLARDHRPHLASLVAGLQDACRSTWDKDVVRYRLMRSADELRWSGAELMTVRFHDHSKVLGLGTVSGQGLTRRIAELNEIYDELDDAYGGLRLDLAHHDELLEDGFWSTHPLHPSSAGHLFLAQQFARLLSASGLSCRFAGLAPTETNLN